MMKAGKVLVVVFCGLLFAGPLFALGVVTTEETTETVQMPAEETTSTTSSQASSGSSFSGSFSLYKPTALGTQTTAAAPNPFSTNAGVGTTTTPTSGASTLSSSKSFKMGQISTASSPSSQAQVQ